jgi:hypothetical protein
MITWLKLIIVAVYGYLAHGARQPIEAAFRSEDTRILARFVAGITLLYPAVMLLEDELHGVPESRLRQSIAYFSAAGAFGGGVILAYIVEAVGGRK